MRPAPFRGMMMVKDDSTKTEATLAAAQIMAEVHAVFAKSLNPASSQATRAINAFAIVARMWLRLQRRHMSKRQWRRLRGKFKAGKL